MPFSIKKISLMAGIAGIFFFSATLAYAQSADVLVNITPGEPQANEEVAIALKSSTLNLDRAKISWIINGKLQEERVGKTSFVFRTGDLGSVSRVRIIISATNGDRIERNFEVRPAEVDLVWEALTYTPPFYKGKALPASKSRIKISAIPHVVLENGRGVSPNDLVYTWTKDRQVLGSSSGAGRQSIVIEAPRLLETTNIIVSVSSANRVYTARNEINITPRNPEVLFYEKHPTGGVRYATALQNEVNLLQEEITLRAEPYFFSGEDLARARVQFNWSLNGNPVEPKTAINELTLKKEVRNGIARLILEIQNASKILQGASSSLLIRF